ncbi:MAG: carbohydrate ABC transporter permease, partial [Caldisericaceae bacterium]
AFMWPLIVNTSANYMVLEVAMYSFIGAEGTNWNLLAAAATMATVPVLVLFLAFQNQFIEGISKGAVKG